MTPELSARIKRLIVETLRLEGRAPESISDDEPLFGGGSLGLDSIDALELVVAIERAFGVTVPDGKVDPDVFRTVRTLAHWLEDRLAAPLAPAGKSSAPG
jgi:acyl carrier protein